MTDQSYLNSLFRSDFPTVSLPLVDPVHLIFGFVSVVASALVYIIYSHSRKKEKSLSGSLKVVKKEELTIAIEPVAEEEEPVRSIKKSISFNTVYNLEEFMVRLYKVGFLVKRLKNGGVEKERFISIDQKGNIRFHKVLESKHNKQGPIKCTTPYFSFSIATLKECFVCDENPPPSFIMDFQGKTLHLAVASTLDRDYIVKGMNLVMQRAKNHANFLIRSSSLLDDPNNTIREETDEYEDDDVSQMSATTMNTTSRSYYGNRR